MPTKGPHTQVWIILMKGKHMPALPKKVQRAPRAVLEKMLDQMMGESDSPIYDQLRRERYLGQLNAPVPK